MIESSISRWNALRVEPAPRGVHLCCAYRMHSFCLDLVTWKATSLLDLDFDASGKIELQRLPR